MEVSVVIVNYNVRHYLEQCLTSLLTALGGISSEVIVVDNNSADGSCSMVREKFPQIKLIPNNHNPGFATATNQGLIAATGKYLLLLNPDTVLPADAISTVLDFMKGRPDAGAAGLRMIDGRGRFLPESKRGLPTPSAAFFRISGIYKLFPRSPFINRYYKGDKPSDRIQQIEVLTGAFMFIRREALEKAGLLDEDFFMYGEDIDLSYRITSAGFTIWYLPEPAIIHYKGESTRQSDFNYLIHFYRSMAIFVRKHMSNKRPGLFILMIKAAILFRAFISLVFRVLRKTAFPLSEAVLFALCLGLASKGWGVVKFSDPGYYPAFYYLTFIPLYSLLWSTGLAITGNYRKSSTAGAILRGVITGTLLITVIYALLPAHLRFSRAVIPAGTAMVFALAWIVRAILTLAGRNDLKGVSNRVKKVIIVSGAAEFEKIRDMLAGEEGQYLLAGRVTPDAEESTGWLGRLENIREVVRINAPDEIIFSSEDIETGRIIEAISSLAGYRTVKKIARTDSQSVLGGRPAREKGKIYTLKLDQKK
ncbi:MAG: glycosyltransferase family 2 protein [Bacteroidales bacterium]|nr:glycosyltransferase family 2 protein [Bacteroidales bacterium]